MSTSCSKVDLVWQQLREENVLRSSKQRPIKFIQAHGPPTKSIAKQGFILPFKDTGQQSRLDEVLSPIALKSNCRIIHEVGQKYDDDVVRLDQIVDTDPLPLHSTRIDSDDSDDEDKHDLHERLTAHHDSGDSWRVEWFASHLKSDDISTRIRTLSALRDVTNSLLQCCPQLPELDFPPPRHENISVVKKTLPLVSDLARPPHHKKKRDDGESSANEEQVNAQDNFDKAITEAKCKLQTIIDCCGSSLFRLIASKSEKCRMLSLECMQSLFLGSIDLSRHIPYLMPCLVARFSKCYYDKDMEIFVQDYQSHEFHKRGGAIDRQDRIGVFNLNGSLHGVIEPNEELRLFLCHSFTSLLRALLSRNSLALIDAYYSDIILSLQSNVTDPFSDVKISSCLLLVQLLRVPQWEQGAKYFSIGLARAALPNCRHRNTKVIVASLDLFEASVCVPDKAKVKGSGSAAIVDLVGYRQENVLPIAAFYDSKCAVSVNTLAEVASHKNARVRLRCCQMMNNFLVYLPDRYDHQQRLLPYVLSYINDSALDVQQSALGCIEECGLLHEREHPDDVIERLQLGVDGDSGVHYNGIALPSPFTRRPSLGARLFIRSNTGRFYLAILDELSNWREETRKRSVDLLLILVVYCEEHLTKDFQQTIHSVAKAIELETMSQRESGHLQTLDKIRQVVRLVSNYIDPSAYIPLLAPRISGDCSSATSHAEDGSHSEKTRSSHVIILSSLIQGSSLNRLVPHWLNIASLLTNSHCIGRYCGTRIRSESLNALLNLSERVRNNDGIHSFITHIRMTGDVSEAKATLHSCKDALLKCQDTLAKECTDNISRLVSSFDQN